MGVQEGTFLTLKVGAAEYGLSILRVSEIINRTALVSPPEARPGIRGMMVWRGKVIPVIDLGARMGQLERQNSRCTGRAARPSPGRRCGATAGGESV